MENDESVYAIEQKGLLALDKYLIAFCIGILPGYFGILARNPNLSEGSKHWAAVLLYYDIPTMFCLLWHSFRWPIRLRIMERNNLEAFTAFSKDMLYYLDNVIRPSTERAVEKLPHIQGKDGASYVPAKVLEEIALGAINSGFSGDNPIVKNILDAHAVKIAKANRDAAIGALDERWACIKQVFDQISRYGRYPLFVALVFCGIKFALGFWR